MRAKLQECFLADLSSRKKEINAIVMKVAEQKHQQALAKRQQKKKEKRTAAWLEATAKLPRPLSEEEARCAVEDMIRGASMESLTAKEIRKQLGVRFKMDLAAIKPQLDEMIMDVVAANQENAPHEKPASKSQRRRAAIDDAKSKLEAELRRLESEVKQDALEQAGKKRKGGMLILGDEGQSVKRMRIKQIRGRWLPALAGAAEGKAIDATDEGMRQALSGVVGLGAIWEHQGGVTLGE